MSRPLAHVPFAQRSPWHRLPALAALSSILLLSPACISIGPKYEKPAAPQAAAFKEGEPWSVATPKDDAMRGNFWELFGDPELNALEAQVNISNQTIAASVANLQQAQALVREARAGYMPKLGLDPAGLSQGGQSPSTGQRGRFSQYTVPLDATWAPDLWGRVEHAVNQSLANAEISAADLENQRLLAHAQLASYFYQLRAQDSLQNLLDSSVTAYQEALQLTTVLSSTGIGGEEAVVQAETQLDVAKAQALDLGIARAKFEHAIALLVGSAPSGFSLPKRELTTVPPKVPVGVPSKLLERRPDIAAAERAVAAANEQIGIAMTAYYPSLTLTGTGGVGANTIVGIAKVPAFFWSVGAALAETLFDGGLREATVDQAKAQYQQTVANYRQSVLVGFQQVEDALAGIRVLEKELHAQDAAVEAAKRYVKIATDRYKLGLDPYLDVITAQTSLLTAQRTQITLAMQQLTTSIDLIEALGGGWDVAKLPSRKDLSAATPQQ